MPSSERRQPPTPICLPYALKHSLENITNLQNCLTFVFSVGFCTLLTVIIPHRSHNLVFLVHDRKGNQIMQKLMFFSSLFILAFTLAMASYRVDGSASYPGVVVAETQDYIDPNKPGYVKSYNYFWVWTGNYGWTGLDYIEVTEVTTARRALGRQFLEVSTKSCGSISSNTYNCSGPGSDVWVHMPGTGQWISTFHNYDNDYPVDTYRVDFYTAYGSPLAATEHYYWAA